MRPPPFAALAAFLLVLGPLAAQQIDRVEYFFDFDPGFGNGTALPIGTPAATFALADENLLLTGPDIRSVGLRARDTLGRWSPTLWRQVAILRGHLVAGLTAAEYFFDNDPGLGNAYGLPEGGVGVGMGSYGTTFVAELSFVPMLPVGPHVLGFRFQQTGEVWGPTTFRPFYIQRLADFADPSTITRAEYFFDTDPGLGNATPATLTGGGLNAAYLFDLGGLAEGLHVLGFRLLDSDGDWGPTLFRPFLLSSLIGPGAAPRAIERLEYYFRPVGGGEALRARNFQPATPGTPLDATFLADLTGVTGTTAGRDYELVLQAVDTAGLRSPASVAPATFIAAYTAWRRAEFSAADAADDAVSGPIADPDGDGVPNLVEFALLLNPLAADPPRLLASGPDARLTWRQRKFGDGSSGKDYTVDGLRYVTEVATVLAPHNFADNSSYTDVISIVDGGDGTETITVGFNEAGRLSEAQLFLRLRLVLNLL